MKNPFKSLERKIEMTIIQKMLAGFLERSCKHYITTVIGILCVLLYAFNNFGTMIPAQYHDLANMVAAIVQGIALILAKDSGNGQTVSIPTPNKLVVPLILLMLMTLALAPAAQAQEVTPVQNFYAAGVSYGFNATPAVSGTGLYARRLTDGGGTYAFTAVDVLPNTLKPFTVNTNVGFGVAQKVATIGTVPIYIPSSAGISWNGSNTGWQWNGGAMALFKVKNYYIAPNVRFLKSSVSNGSGYQPIVGLLFGWGK